MTFTAGLTNSVNLIAAFVAIYDHKSRVKPGIISAVLGFAAWRQPFSS